MKCKLQETTIYLFAANEFIKVNLQFTSHQKGSLEIMNLTGKTVLVKELQFINGTLEKKQYKQLIQRYLRHESNCKQ